MRVRIGATPTNETERLLNVNEVADMIGMRPKTVYDWIASGKLPYVKCGRSVRFSPSAVAEWIARNSVAERESRRRG